MRGLQRRGTSHCRADPRAYAHPRPLSLAKLAHAVAAPISERIAACGKPRTVLVDPASRPSIILGPPECTLLMPELAPLMEGLQGAQSPPTSNRRQRRP